MSLVPGEILMATIEKHELRYRVIIVKELNGNAELPGDPEVFNGVLIHPYTSKMHLFTISRDEHFRWIPDLKDMIDPWLADTIGEAIEKSMA